MSEGDCNGCGGGDGVERQDEHIGNVSEKIGDDHKGHGGMDYAREIAVRVKELAGHVICLIMKVSKEFRKGARVFEGCTLSQPS